ncbi:hypothetical protein CLAFUW4_14326 [Fulvia fulva]|uniref:Uncharacterized protein n=1 Tax=Passalora fulva TaxID=5499 RepID=A0A9Q8PLZ4_PASFU|nr:uncharacterized protein CLAFUR5_14159 [Fulvia fulva]KAK4609185.1 hypothetical protein CLAFUR4_14325 [Fulvia fulva]KAK4609707.1 hypothetical protein CLAFUR0_14329 [Fulvia fulva]UJO24883.1 hypothetical protein CLAFUR5_14159 [Fulvia fulva]WPV22727.1 hypothetical protein CLAFUW4_14326 [Fulvia fulva]WPV37548.1 hypothetical protein CLAFUW7_14333 [Fulvia fulva]
MGLFSGFFSSSSRGSSRQWYGNEPYQSSSRSGHDAYHASASRSGRQYPDYSRAYQPQASNAYHSRRDPYGESSSRRRREVEREPYYNFTRDDRRYSFGHRQGHSEQIRFGQAQGHHLSGRHQYQPAPENLVHYSRDPYRSRHSKPYNPDRNRFADFDQTTRAGQREHERYQAFGGRNGGYGYDGRSGGGYSSGSAAHHLEMNGRYPRFR